MKDPCRVKYPCTLEEDVTEGVLLIFSLKERRGFRTASIADCLTQTRVPLLGVVMMLLGGDYFKLERKNKYNNKKGRGVGFGRVQETPADRSVQILLRVVHPMIGYISRCGIVVSSFCRAPTNV